MPSETEGEVLHCCICKGEVDKYDGNVCVDCLAKELGLDIW